MGGFAGGDEGGYWDDPNVFISSKRNDNNINTANSSKPLMKTGDFGYSIQAHARVKISEDADHRCSKELFDILQFIPCECETFTIENPASIPLESKILHKTYNALVDLTHESDIVDFFTTHKVVLTKSIPVSPEFGGASSDAAAFIWLVREACSLILTIDEMAKIGSYVDDDVAFFIYNYPDSCYSRSNISKTFFKQ